MHTSLRLLARGDEVVGVDNLNDYYDVSLKEARLARLQGQPGFRFHKLAVEDRDGMARLACRGLAGREALVLGANDRRDHPAWPSRLVGREAELARLDEAIRAHDERRRVVMLRGPSGIGKSALVRAETPSAATAIPATSATTTIFRWVALSAE